MSQLLCGSSPWLSAASICFIPAENASFCLPDVGANPRAPLTELWSPPLFDLSCFRPFFFLCVTLRPNHTKLVLRWHRSRFTVLFGRTYGHIPSIWSVLNLLVRKTKVLEPYFGQKRHRRFDLCDLMLLSSFSLFPNVDKKVGLAVVKVRVRSSFMNSNIWMAEQRISHHQGWMQQNWTFPGLNQMLL